ncbi:MAG: M4 family metallopeptidase [Chitinophagaceae bacterium]|nr:M4 family metallopeptidase [Chitinophagaceae bacterium]
MKKFYLFIHFLSDHSERISALRKSLLFGLLTCLILMLPNPLLAQNLTPQQQFESITESESTMDLFTIKKDINITKEEFISKYIQVLNLTEGSEMKFVKSETNEIGITQNFYQQYLNGIKLEGAEMRIHVQNGRVKYINGMYAQRNPLNNQVLVKDSIALLNALAIIQSKDYLWQNLAAEDALKEIKHDPEASYKPKAELVYAATHTGAPNELEYVLCWKFAINVEPAIESYIVYINAATGEVFNKIPLVYACSAGSGTTLWNGVQNINTQLNAGVYRAIDDCISAQIITKNGNGANTGVGATDYTDADNVWPSTALGKYIVQTHWGMRATRDYFFNIHGQNGFDDLGHDYTSYLNPGFSNNAYYSSSTETFSFGGTSTGGSPIVCLDASAHEATHGMIDFSSGLAYQNESGALNESFADIFGESCEAYILPSHDWLIAADLSIGPLRSMSNPNAYNDPDTYHGTNWVTTGCASPSSANDYCGVHTNSGVQNFWYYLLVEGGSGTNDNGNAYNVSGIGFTQARAIAWQTMRTLTSGGTYANARTISIQAAKDFYGDCSNAVVQTTNAWYAVGVGAAYVAPAPLTITVSTTSSYLCPGSSATVTAFGANTYAWSNGLGSGNPKVIAPSGTTTYTVTGTDAEQCTGTKSFTLNITPEPTVTPFAVDNDLCPGGSTLLSAGTNETITSLQTTLAGGNGLSGNAFNIHAYNSITITDFNMNIAIGAADSAEVYYKTSSYGNANVTSNVGWIKLGSTVAITPMGSGNLTKIPTTSNLTIPAGSTYGIIILVNGSNIYTNGTLVGSIEASNSDLYITEGHGGYGFGGTFNFTISPRVFNGSVEYRVNYTNYLWSPSSTLNSATSSVPTATPTSSTTYTLTATDGNGCTNTGTVRVNINSLPDINSITATPTSFCIGGNTQLSVSASSLENDFLTTTLAGGNGFAGNVFDITAQKNITINYLYMNINTGTNAEVWYKAGGYGGTSLTSSAGWTKLGATVAISPAGAGSLTYIPITASLSIPAGQTYGVVVVCDGSNNYTNGNNVGDVIAQNPDLMIKTGHGGSGMAGAFSFTNASRIWNGQFNYQVDNQITGYTWSGGNLSSSTIFNPIASPFTSTTYTLTVTDGNGCTNTNIERVYVNPAPQVQLGVSPNSACPGSNQTLSTTMGNPTKSDAILTTVSGTNGYGPNGGVVFDVTTTKQITITGVKMNIDTGATQAEVWYKSGGYGGASLTSSAGWTKLGATVAITPAGAGALTNIPITSNLIIGSGQTYGLAVVCNGDVNYSNGTSVGSVYVNNADLSVKEGHGGAGFGGTFNFINSPRVFNGELAYNAVTTLSGYAWTPNTNISNTSISNPVVTPLSSTAYSVTVTDNSGCTATGSIGVEVMSTPLGTATASPSTLCLGSNINLNYTAPAGSQCNGVVQSGFAGSFAPATWSTVLTNSNGTVNIAAAPNSITMTSSNGLSGNGVTGYQHVMPCSGFVTFNWSYTTADSGPQYDYPRYSINGGTAVVFPGFKAQSGHPLTQVGTFSVYLNAGETLQLQAYSSDNVGGACSIVLSNFKAPYQTVSAQTVQWFATATGGPVMSSLSSYTFPSTTAGAQTYYAQVTNVATGCLGSTRVATNIINVDAPNTAVSASASTICEGSSTTITASGAVSYSWAPGGQTSAAINVSPTTTTTYTVTGTSSLGCTKTAVITITVNPAPVIAGSASPGIVCPGGAVTLTGTTPGVTWNWQPGNLNGSPVIVNPLLQTTYTVTATSAAGCTKTQTFVILMNPVPSVSTSASPSATFCAGGSATITATSATATGYTWSPGGGTGSTLITTLANTYTVTATNAQGCTATATQVINVNALPTVGATTTNATICAGSSTSVTGTGATSYSWMPGSLTGTTVNVSPTTTTTYTVTGTNANGCTQASTIMITVNPAPSVGTTTPWPSVCVGQSSNITANGANTYSWSPGGMAGTTVSVTPLITTTYTVTGTTTATGCTATATRTIVVNPLPNVGASASLSTICSGNSTTLTGVGASTYIWEPGSIAGNPISVFPGATTTYTVTGTNANGCVNTATQTITVNNCNSIVNVKLFIEGYYIGGGLMNPALLNQGVGISPTVADTIEIQLRDPITFALVATAKTLLNTNGNATCNFAGFTGNYYLAIRHRNAVETWSMSTVTLGAIPVNYDFSVAAAQAYGLNQVEVASGIFAFFSGDIDQSGGVDGDDFNLLDPDIQFGNGGYLSTDLDGSGGVDGDDFNIFDPNVQSGVGAFLP